jgi:carboxyl-terminal processing protease
MTQVVEVRKKHCVAVICCLSFGAIMISRPLLAEAQAAASGSWGVNGHDPSVEVKASGAVETDPGADIILKSSQASSKSFGATLVVDGASFAKHEVAMTADLSVLSGAGEGVLWMRADSAGGGREYTSSLPVAIAEGSTGATHQIEVRADVPTGTIKMSLGVAFKGQAVAHFARVKLQTVRTLPASPSPAAVLDAALTVIRTHALHADRVNWEQASAEAHKATAAAEVPVDVYSAIRHVFGLLGDRHSSLSNPYQARALAASGGSADSVAIRRADDGILYLNMPSYRGHDSEAASAYVAAVRQKISEAGDAKGWIIDLRSNSGGNMWPMLSALQPFLGNEKIGGFVENDKSTPWFPSGHAAGAEHVNAALIHMPVALLLGPHTASSGEIVAVAFHGRSNARSFGTHTAGFSTSNAEFSLPDGSVLHLSTSVAADRNGALFEDGLNPDQIIDGADTHAAEAAAVSWIRQQHP